MVKCFLYHRLIFLSHSKKDLECDITNLTAEGFVYPYENAYKQVEYTSAYVHNSCASLTDVCDFSEDTGDEKYLLSVEYMVPTHYTKLYSNVLKIKQSTLLIAI